MICMTNLEVIKSRNDFDLAVGAALVRLGLSWEELVIEAYSDQWSSEDARLTWEMIQETIGML